MTIEAKMRPSLPLSSSISIFLLAPESTLGQPHKRLHFRPAAHVRGRAYLSSRDLFDL